MFWKRKTHPSELTLDAAFKAIGLYADLVVRHPTAFLDTSMLPLPKPLMKQALTMAWEKLDDEDLKFTVEQGYGQLANFQGGVGKKPIDCAIQPGADPAKDGAMLKRWLAWSKMAQAESDLLLEEWFMFTGGPADGGESYTRLANQCIQNNDYAGAETRYRLAAYQGNVRAQAQLGRMYAIGGGVPQNIALAVKWTRAAAEQGDAYSQAYLGDIYANGRDVPVDHVAAANWCRLAADQGHAGGQLLLGSLYHNGEGVPRDLIQAYVLFSLAAQGRPGAKPEHVQQAASLRDFVATKLGHGDLALAQAAFDRQAMRHEDTHWVISALRETGLIPISYGIYPTEAAAQADLERQRAALSKYHSVQVLRRPEFIVYRRKVAHTLPLKEITRARYDEMYDMLPPIHCKPDGEVERFLFPEFYSDDWTRQFAALGSRCFEALVDSTDPSTWITAKRIRDTLPTMADLGRA